MSAMQSLAARTQHAANVLEAVPLCAFCHELEVVRAASAAGALGVLGATRMWPDDIAAALNSLEATLEGKPYGVNLVFPKDMPAVDDRDALERQIPQEHKDFVEGIRQRYAVPPLSEPSRRFPRTDAMTKAQLEVVLASKVPVVAMGLGTDPEIVGQFHDAGKVVISLVGTPRQAERAVANGADVIVAQGADAAAHTGSIGTFSLVPAVVDAVGDVPVFAAGGITTGRHMAAAMALGAAGFWLGTTWLLTTENNTLPPLQRKLLAAGTEDTVVLRADSGKPQRNVRSAWAEEWMSPEAPAPLRMPLQDVLVGDLVDAVNEWEVEPLVHYPAGQGIGMIHEVTTVAERVELLLGELRSTLCDLEECDLVAYTSAESA